MVAPRYAALEIPENQDFARFLYLTFRKELPAKRQAFVNACGSIFAPEPEGRALCL